MTDKNINLRLPVLIQEIENVLEDYPEYPYQSAFAIDELRQKLIAHVISQIPHQHTVMEAPQNLPKKPNNSYSPLHQRLYR